MAQKFIKSREAVKESIKKRSLELRIKLLEEKISLLEKSKKETS